MFRIFPFPLFLTCKPRADGLPYPLSEISDALCHTGDARGEGLDSAVHGLTDHACKHSAMMNIGVPYEANDFINRVKK